MSSPLLFTKIKLDRVELPNRIVVAPMCQYSAKDGCVTDWHTMHVMQYLISGAGLFMLEATGVTMDGRISPSCLALTNDEQEDKLRRLLDSGRQYGSAKIGIQLNHSGRKGSSAPVWLGGGPLTESAGGWSVFAPSAIPFADGWPVPTEYSEQDLQDLINAFADSTRRSVRVGFDVLEIHAAHGYLLHQFLSPISNQRQDAYGGSPEARRRFPLQVVKAVREAWPQDRALGIRVSASDWITEGLNVTEVTQFLLHAKSLGVDYVCVSSGGIRSDIRIPVAPGYQVSFASEIRKATGLITRAVGMILDPFQAEDILQAGHADQIAIARGFLDDPRWVWRAADALGVDIPYPPQYARAAPAVWPGFRHRATFGVNS